jgi:hypothetical protein
MAAAETEHADATANAASTSAASNYKGALRPSGPSLPLAPADHWCAAADPRHGECHRLSELSNTSRDLIDALAVAGCAVSIAELSRLCDIAAGPDCNDAVVLGSAEDDRAMIMIDAAAAFPAWRDTSLAKRSAVLFGFRELLNLRKHEMADIITAEHGKVVSDAWGRSAAARRSSNSPAVSRICSRATSSRTPQPRSTSTRSASFCPSKGRAAN